MRRLITSLVVSTVLTVAGAVPAEGSEVPCTNGDLKGLASAGSQAAKLYFERGMLTGLGGAWGKCQFRLFDDNDIEPDNPEVPHVFTVNDYVLAGILNFEFYELFDRPDYDRAAAIAYLKTVEDRLYWGPADSPDADMEEVDLVQSPYRDAVFGALGHIVVNHRYHVFEPGSVAPGEYKWRWQQVDPVLGLVLAAEGSVVILDD